MIKKSEVPVEVELVGFNQRDRLLFSSLFKVSEMRLFNYLEWKPENENGPVCLLLDVDHDDHMKRCDREHVQPSGIPIIAIGEKVPSTIKVAAHIKRPIRWAEILHTLDTVLWKAARPNLPMPTEKKARSESSHVVRLPLLSPEVMTISQPTAVDIPIELTLPTKAASARDATNLEPDEGRFGIKQRSICLYVR